jgi:anti-anti-sigma factor
MTNAMCNPMPTLMIAPFESAERAELARGPLVREQIAGLVERLSPLVREHDVALDLTSVDRIDGAGITALVALFRGARETGHRFILTNVPERVAQILSAVGLDGILFSRNAVRKSQCGPHMRRPAA